MRKVGQGPPFLLPKHSVTRYFHRKAAGGGLAVFRVHVAAGFVHGLDDFVEGDAWCAGAAQRHAAGVDRFYRTNGVTLDARHLHLPADGVAGEAEVVFHADFRRHAHLFRCATHDFDSR